MAYLSQLNYKVNSYLRNHWINKTNRSKLKVQDLTLLCNNCLGGFILHDLGLAFQTPTINLYIEPQDYLTLLEHLESFLNCDLIEVTEPNYPQWMADCPVGMLQLQRQTDTGTKFSEVQIYFIHYSTFQQAKECWDKRTNRMNYKHLFVILQLDTIKDETLLRRFEKLPYRNKICLTFDPGKVNSRLLQVITNRKGEHRIWDYVGSSGKRYYDQFDYVGWFHAGCSLKQEKKVILVADCFNVDKLVGSRRVTAMASYLLEHGIKPYIITAHPFLYHTTVERESLEKEFMPVRIISRRFYWLCRLKIFHTLDRRSSHPTIYQRYSFQIKQEKRNTPLSIIKRIVNRLIFTLDQLRLEQIYHKLLTREKEELGKQYAKEVEKILANQGERVTIITSVGGQSGYYEEAPIRMMHILLQRKAKVEWIYDMRDKLHSHYASEERNRIAIMVERFIVKHAKYIVAVSYGERQSFMDVIGLGYEEARKIKVIYNGYVKQEKGVTDKEELFSKEVLTLAYTGKTYPGIFSSQLLFDAIARLIAKGQIKKDGIQLHYAGNEAQALSEVAKQYGLEHIFIDHGFLTQREVKGIQDSADLLFAMTVNVGSDIGRMPYKILEYLGYEKPMIVIVAGDKPKAEIKYVLEETKAGVCFEEIDYEHNLEELMQYLLSQYKRKESFGKLSYQGDRDALNRYSCEHQFFNYLTLL